MSESLENDRQLMESEKRRGQQAQAILDNQVWKDAVRTINESLLEKMGDIDVYNDPKACQLIAMAKRTNDNYVEYFETIAESGKLAEFQLAKE